MAIEALRRVAGSVAEAVESLVWYYRTRPNAERRLAVPLAASALLALWFFVVWGVLGLVFALVVVCTFAVSIAPFVEEIHSLVHGTQDIDFDLRAAPWHAEQEDAEQDHGEHGGQAGGEDAEPATVAVAQPAEEPTTLDDDALRPVFELTRLPERRRLPPRSRVPRPAPGAARKPEPPAPRAPVPLPEKARYLVRALVDGLHEDVYTGRSFLEASDEAFEFIERCDPAEMEIVRIEGDEQETVWTYRRSESAAERGRQGTTEIFGFDAARWQGPGQLRARR